MKNLCLIAAAVVLLCAVLAAQDVTDPDVAVHSMQHVAVQHLAAEKAADESGGAIAKAALAVVLSGLRVSCEPGADPLSAVESDGGSLQTMAGKISGAPCRSHGRTQHISASFVPNGDIRADHIVVALRDGKPLLMEWKRTLYVLYGAVYDEHIHASGRRENVIRQLLLIDPRHSGKQRYTAFVREKDSLADVTGLASVSVTSASQ